jgi:hypothetical protein
MTYKIGTRVRVVLERSKHRGKECVITGVNVPGRDPVTGPFLGYEVNLDAPDWHTGFAVYERHELSPIIPNGHRAGEEGTCDPLDKLLSEVRDGQTV